MPEQRPYQPPTPRGKTPRRPVDKKPRTAKCASAGMTGAVFSRWTYSVRSAPK